MGADLVGGCSYNDTDGAEHVRIVFGLAEAFGVEADFHVDFADEAERLHIKHVIAETLRTGWQRRVAVGHLTEVAAVAPYHQDELVARIAAAGIGVIALPLTDHYLMGRHDDMNVRRGLARIRRLLDGRVRVALASNNLRHPFTPVGTADLVDVANVAAVAAHMGAAATLAWTGQSLAAVAVYVADGKAMALPLLADGLIHDWNYILGALGWLDHAARLGRLTFGLGLIAMSSALVILALDLYAACYPPTVTQDSR